MAENRKGRTERPAEWQTRPGSTGAGDGERAGGDEAGSHFEGDFGADELPRRAAGRDRDSESTDPPGER